MSKEREALRKRIVQTESQTPTVLLMHDSHCDGLATVMELLSSRIYIPFSVLHLLLAQHPSFK